MADTDIDTVRALIPDKELIYDGNYMFEDADIQLYLDAANGNTLRAAGYAVMAIATSEALISKVIRTQDLQTNGALVSDSLIKKANGLFDQADKADARGTLDYFELIDFQANQPVPELTEWNWNV